MRTIDNLFAKPVFNTLFSVLMDLPLFFISDVHLMLHPHENENIKQAKLFQFLDYVIESKGTLFIVGDLFDFWFEYKHVIPKVYFPFLTKLQAVRDNGVDIHYILGNHDYWVREFITDTIMTKTYFDDAILELNDKHFLITHGDGLLSWDHAYRVLKRVIRNPLFIKCFGGLHPSLGYRFANWISKRGQHFVHADEYNKRIVDDLLVFAQAQFEKGFDYVITGHYHQVSEVDKPGGKLIILGDWINYYSYAVFDGQDLYMKTWDKQ